MKRRAAALCGATTITAALLWNAAPASAHHPEVVVANTCVDGTPTVTVTASAWETDLEAERRINTDVRIDAWGPRTAQSSRGVFVAPDYQSRVVFEVPDAIGDTLTIRATAVAPWGPNGQYGFAGTWRETAITVADVCPPTSAPTTTTTVVTAPQEDSSTIEERAPEAPAALTTPPLQDDVPVQVLGATVTRVRAQTPEPATQAATLAFTGDHTSRLATVGLMALVMGAAACVVARRETAQRIETVAGSDS